MNSELIKRELQACLDHHLAIVEKLKKAIYLLDKEIPVKKVSSKDKKRAEISRIVDIALMKHSSR